MPSSSEDQWINDQLSSGPISELEDTTIAVDASYYLQTFMQNPPYQEPLLPALGGLTGIHSHIETDLDNWKEHKVTPFFIFDGLCVVGYDEVAVQRAKEAVKGTDQAWELYFASHANEAVAAFGSHKGYYLPITF
ncbi:PIN domain-like protein [Xylariaceae sp. FL1019]|nr:PIN domain-like protein [Xylariaceae sp. FL1019]